MAPSTTGTKSADHFRSVELCRVALDIASKTLNAGGSFVCKIFQGEDFQAFLAEVKPKFKLVKTFKPPSSRAESKEMFVIGKGFSP
jgi:23S rRNA (uridine2552-2'-O)-methyltransferase